MFTQSRVLAPAAFLLVVSWCLHGTVLAADNWPQFRGPAASGVSANSGLPDAWSETDHVEWKTPIPGRSWSSPIVWGERIFVTTAIKEGGKLEPVKKGLYFGGDRPVPKEAHRFAVYCLDLETGRIVWEKEVHRGVPQHGHHLKNTLASETPVTDGERVYVLYDMGLLACYNAKTGEEVYGKRRIGPGARAFTSSPWAYDGKLFCLNEDGDTFVIQAGPEFKLLAKNSLGGLCMATPAIVRDGLIVRTEFHLLRIK